ncbi:hypothetical protein Acr_00g0063860 [Actinidia rufa]|uniref:Uncharacterized protein n=1 Tax=Actinidia rufa TaxID=165716 RepID=A0A7J0DPK6_9ERIC|nr:hypothetical protein Acr_00g0063860 [Actinidia rufa]
MPEALDLDLSRFDLGLTDFVWLHLTSNLGLSKVDLTPSLAGPSTSFVVACWTSNRLRHLSLTLDSPRQTSDKLRRCSPDLQQASPCLAGPQIIFVIASSVWRTLT